MRERIQAQILEALARSGRVVWGAVADAQDGTLGELHAAVAALSAEGLVTLHEGSLALTDAGLAQASRGGEAVDPRCVACDGRGYAIGDHRDSFAELERLLVGRPPPRLDFDQGAITVEDAWVRAGFLRERGDLHGSRILMVGDFDLLSLAFALVGKPERIVVLDIDTRVLDFLAATAAREGFPIETRPFDVRHALDTDLVGAFDFFHCDPVETLGGIRLYLSRGTQALHGSGAGLCLGLTSIEASRAKWYDIQRLLSDMGFVVTDVRRRFNGYPDHDHEPEDSTYTYPVIDALGVGGVGHRWYRSALIRAEAVRTPVPAVVGPVVLDDALYVDDEAWATPRAASAAPRLLGEGFDFRVLEHGDGTVLRVPKSAAVAAQVATEVAYLAVLRRTLTVAVPEARLETVDDAPAMSYRRLPGEPGDQVTLGADGRRRLAAETGRFLAALHAIDRDAFLGGGPRFREQTFHLRTRLEKIRREIRESWTLSAALEERCRRFLAGEALPPDSPGPPRLLHGDLEAEHLLVDPGTGALTGVLDWSEIGFGDPARDLGGVWAHFGDEFLDTMLAAYAPERDLALVARVRFFGRCHALSAYDEALRGDIPVTHAAALAQLERVFSGEPR